VGFIVQGRAVSISGKRTGGVRGTAHGMQLALQKKEKRPILTGKDPLPIRRNGKKLKLKQQRPPRADRWGSEKGIIEKKVRGFKELSW